MTLVTPTTAKEQIVSIEKPRPRARATLVTQNSETSKLLQVIQDSPPLNTSFSKYRIPSSDQTQPTYSLPPYLNQNVQTLLEKINAHSAPNDLAANSFPFLYLSNQK